MGRPKQFDERIQLTLVEGTTARMDALLTEGEYRLDFVRTAIEAEIEKRLASKLRSRKQAQGEAAADAPSKSASKAKKR